MKKISSTNPEAVLIESWLIFPSVLTSASATPFELVYSEVHNSSEHILKVTG